MFPALPVVSEDPVAKDSAKDRIPDGGQLEVFELCRQNGLDTKITLESHSGRAQYIDSKRMASKMIVPFNSCS